MRRRRQEIGSRQSSQPICASLARHIAPNAGFQRNPLRSASRFLHCFHCPLHSEAVVKGRIDVMIQPFLKQASTKLRIIAPRQWGLPSEAAAGSGTCSHPGCVERDTLNLSTEPRLREVRVRLPSHHLDIRFISPNLGWHDWRRDGLESHPGIQTMPKQYHRSLPDPAPGPVINAFAGINKVLPATASIGPMINLQIER